jgi:peptidoglycan hydrolase-like protein with peptidoglycan-binding domain
MNQKLGTGGIHVEYKDGTYDLSKVGAGVPIPATFMPEGFYPTVDLDFQSQEPACGPFAGSYMKSLKMNLAGVPNSHRSPQYLATTTKQIDGFPVDAGTDIYSLLTAMVKPGVCSFELGGNNSNLAVNDYYHLNITPEMTADANANSISSYAITYKPTFDQLKQAIFNNKGVIILMRVGENMYTPSWQESDILPLSATKYPMDSGHFVDGIAYDENYVYWANWWSKQWGKNGIGYFGADYMQWVDAIGTIVDRELLLNPVLPQFTGLDMTIGTNNIQVKNLQIFLNNEGYEVAASGPGSKGNETTYFGYLTQSALAEFQMKNNISPAKGYFGSITRGVINKLIK